MQPFVQQIKAYYRGPESKLFNEPEKEYELSITTFGSTSPRVEVLAFEGKTSIGYPSKKKFLEHWDPTEGWHTGSVVKMPTREGKKVRESLTFAEAGGVMYTEIVSAINRFNAKSALTYVDKPDEKPEFSIRLEQQIYNEETQAASGLYGAGVLMMEIKQFGLKRVIWQDGVSFKTKKELDNIGGYAPKLYISAFDGLVESALMYVLALNPDNIENAKVIQDVKEEQIPTIKGDS